jgi:hypothetical protein
MVVVGCNHRRRCSKPFGRVRWIGDRISLFEQRINWPEIELSDDDAEQLMTDWISRQGKADFPTGNIVF